MVYMPQGTLCPVPEGQNRAKPVVYFPNQAASGGRHNQKTFDFGLTSRAGYAEMESLIFSDAEIFCQKRKWRAPQRRWREQVRRSSQGVVTNLRSLCGPAP